MKTHQTKQICKILGKMIPNQNTIKKINYNNITVNNIIDYDLSFITSKINMMKATTNFYTKRKNSHNQINKLIFTICLISFFAEIVPL